MATKTIEGIVLELLKNYRYNVVLARPTGNKTHTETFLAAGHSPIRSQNPAGYVVEFYSLIGTVVRTFNPAEIVYAYKG